MLHARLVLSPHPHARVVAVPREIALAVPGVAAVVTEADLPPGGSSQLLAGDETRDTARPGAAGPGEAEAAAGGGARPPWGGGGDRGPPAGRCPRAGRRPAA